MDSKKSADTRSAYNTAADTYRVKYETSKVRADDVELAFSLCNAEKPNVLEIGCAYGRDAKYILTKTDHYVGIDISDTFIGMAQTEIPDGVFRRVDILEYKLDTKFDIVFAFASLLHLNKNEIKSVLRKVHAGLNDNGIVILSLKLNNQYHEQEENDGITTRHFFYYNRAIINELVGDKYEEVYYDEQQRDIPWFTMVLKKA